ncbi:hypothetical protein AERO9AM_10164 [Aeromicrobium sp. 9AM]|nr:hypothetical protein AERO9AM_10164 [Aeromicrobium sp. 9AM]
MASGVSVIDAPPGSFHANYSTWNI